MLSKESKIRMLENFHAIDYVFFGKPILEVEACCPLIKEEFMSIKGALLSVYIEMLKLVEHKPEVIEEKISSKDVLFEAKESAKIARENAEAIVTSKKSRQNIKEGLKEKIKEDKDVNLTDALQEEIRQKAFSLAIDNLLVGRIIDESTSFDKLNEWEGVIIEDSYKILRTNLVESAYDVLEADLEDLEELSKATKQNIKYGATRAAAAGGTVYGGVAAAGSKKGNRAKNAGIAGAVGAGLGGAAGALDGALKAKRNRKKCKKLFPNDAKKYKDCTMKLAWGAK